MLAPTPPVAPSPVLNAMEPASLLASFHRHPPLQFSSWLSTDGVQGFTAPFDLLTTAPQWSSLLKRLPFYQPLQRALTWETAFVGTTVSEFLRLPAGVSPTALARHLRQDEGEAHRLLIVKDLPNASPLLSQAENEQSKAFLNACVQEGYVSIAGQALAYVPIDFTDIDDYLSMLSAKRRKDIRRKLRMRDRMTVRYRHTGDAYYDDPGVRNLYYTQYLSVFEQSELKFDCLSAAFMGEILTTADPTSIIVEYWYEGRLAGFNLSYYHRGNLVDKYVGFEYPLARTLNLYFVSWIVNLELALQAGCTNYIAGWTDPEIKSYLGARFTCTRHAVYTRHKPLRWALKHLSGHFEMDGKWSDDKGFA